MAKPKNREREIEGRALEKPEDRGQSVASIASDVLRDGRTSADASAAASATISETGHEVSSLLSLTAILLRDVLPSRGYSVDLSAVTRREQPTPVTIAHVSAPDQPIDSGIMVLTRVRQKLQELVREGVLRSDVHITEVTVSGQRFLEVKAFMPYALFRDTEQRHGLYDSLERLGDSSIHVDAHIYRYRAD